MNDSVCKFIYELKNTKGLGTLGKKNRSGKTGGPNKTTTQKELSDSSLLDFIFIIYLAISIFHLLF